MNYSIDTTLLIESLLPISKRSPIIESYLIALGSPLTRLNGIQNEYINGASYSNYLATATYSTGDRVFGRITDQNAIFESLTGSNHNNLLTDTNWWIETQPNFIGVNERSLYNSTKMNLEYNLNKYFGTTYSLNTGVTSYGPLPTIYISNNLTYRTEMCLGGYLSEYIGHGTAFDGVGAGANDYTVNIANSAWTTSVFPGMSASVVDYLERYNPAGCHYSIAIY